MSTIQNMTLIISINDSSDFISLYRCKRKGCVSPFFECDKVYQLWSTYDCSTKKHGWDYIDMFQYSFKNDDKLRWGLFE